LLVLLVVLTVVAGALSMDQIAVMSAPMGIAVYGGVADNGMSDMAMAGMPAAGWSISSAVTFVFVWTVMMAAMMLPAIAPMLSPLTPLGLAASGLLLSQQGYSVLATSSFGRPRVCSFMVSFRSAATWR
jgi:predicted metal-binding membrane protein